MMYIFNLNLVIYLYIYIKLPLTHKLEIGRDEVIPISVLLNWFPGNVLASMIFVTPLNGVETKEPYACQSIQIFISRNMM